MIFDKVVPIKSVVSLPFKTDHTFRTDKSEDRHKLSS